MGEKKVSIARVNDTDLCTANFLTFGNELLPDLPCEYCRVLPLVRLNLGHDLWRRHLGLGPANHPWRPPAVWHPAWADHAWNAAALRRRRSRQCRGGNDGCDRGLLRRPGGHAHWNGTSAHSAGGEVPLLQIHQLPLMDGEGRDGGHLRGDVGAGSGTRTPRSRDCSLRRSLRLRGRGSRVQLTEPCHVGHGKVCRGRRGDGDGRSHVDGGRHPVHARNLGKSLYRLGRVTG
jgi:hypothetical protein